MNPIKSENSQTTIISIPSKEKSIVRKYNPFDGKLYIPSKEGAYLVDKDSIVRLEASGNYTTIYLNNGAQHLVSKTMKKIVEKLPDTIFFKIHKSHVVNLSMLTFVGNSKVEIEGKIQLPLSRAVKSKLQDLLNDIKY